LRNEEGKREAVGFENMEALVSTDFLLVLVTFREKFLAFRPRKEIIVDLEEDSNARNYPRP